MPLAEPRSSVIALLCGFRLPDILTDGRDPPDYGPLAFKTVFCEFILSLSFTNYKV